MLKYRLIHPELLETLGKSGHGDQVLLADSNFPFRSKAPSGAKVVYLNLAPGFLTVTDILKVLLNAIPVEGAAVMSMDGGGEPPIAEEFRQILPPEIRLGMLARHEFYDAVQAPTTTLVIASGEQRLYANLLLTIGVVSG
jgi:L-fucose mutarotase